MIRVESIDQVLCGMRLAKNGGADFCTNLFAGEARLESWIGRRELFAVAGHGAVLFLKRDRNFWRLYFCAGSPDLLDPDLLELPELEGTQLVVDLVGPDNGTTRVRAALECAGWQDYATLQRMTRKAPGEPARPSIACRVATAQPGEAAAILRLIEENFDPYADQIPTLEEVEAAVHGGCTLAAYDRDNISGILWFETQGASTSIRFLAVDARSRGRGVGSGLMAEYLRACRDSRRCTLWVNARNADAIEVYRRYGYVPDGLADRNLLRTGSFRIGGSHENDSSGVDRDSSRV